MHTATSAGSSSTFVDSELENTDDYINGREWLGTSGTNDGASRIVDNYAGSTTTGTIRGDVLSASIADGDTYELWDADVKIAAVHDAMNRSIRANPRYGPALRDLSLHSSSRINNFTIPTSVVGLSQVQIRVNHTEKVIHNGDASWDELGTVANVTTSNDPEDRREGAGSQKFVIAAGAAAGLVVASASISSLDLSKMTHGEFWIKSNVTTTGSADLQLILSSTASAGTETELLSVPALTADVWTWVRVALANPEDDTAIISIGLKYSVDIGAVTIWTDGVVATVQDSEDWITIHRQALKFDLDNRSFSINYWDAPSGSSYALIKLLGVKKPTELNADATSCDLEPEYIINQSIAHLYRRRGDRRGGTRDAAMLEAQSYEALALNALSKQQRPNGIIWISDN